MSDKEERLQRLRQHAERALDAMDIGPEISVSNIEDRVHELRVYYADLEIQLEDLRNANEQLTADLHPVCGLFVLLCIVCMACVLPPFMSLILT